MAVIHPPRFEPPNRGPWLPILIVLWLAFYGAVFTLSRQQAAPSSVATASEHDYTSATGDEHDPR